MKKYLLALILFFVLSPFSFLYGQELYDELQEEFRVQVVNVLEDTEKAIQGTDISGIFQILEVKILDGKRAGEILEIENDFQRLKKGDKFFLSYLKTVDGTEFYSVGEIDRRNVLYFFVALFIISVLFFGIKKGLRSLISLFGSLYIIIYFLIPALLKGLSPALTISFFAVLILAFAMYVTHGFNKTTHSAFLGTSVTILFVSFLSQLGVSLAKLSGFASDETLYLNLYTGGVLDFEGLLLGAIIIGVLGILDDVSITQAASVREIYQASDNISKKEVFKIAFNIGREHVMSLVNTLALAYAGASLPLLLLFSESSLNISLIINKEIFATEIIRTIVGSIGLIMAVPITTILAVFMIKKSDKTEVLPHSHTH